MSNTQRAAYKDDPVWLFIKVPTGRRENVFRDAKLLFLAFSARIYYNTLFILHPNILMMMLKYTDFVITPFDLLAVFL